MSPITDIFMYSNTVVNVYESTNADKRFIVLGEAPPTELLEARRVWKTNKFAGLSFRQFLAALYGGSKIKEIDWQC